MIAQVENKFMNSWKFPNTRIPIIQRIYKIIENESFLQPYDKYKCVSFIFSHCELIADCYTGKPCVMKFLDTTERRGNALLDRPEIHNSAVTLLALFALY
jgi:hypothetical protein